MLGTLLDTARIYFTQFISHPLTLFVLIASLFLSTLFYFLFKKTDQIKVKVSFLYTHIFFLFFPFLFSFFIKNCWKCILPLCDCSTKVLVYGISAGIGIAFISSFILLPYLYTWANKSQEVNEGKLKGLLLQHCQALGLPLPKLYTFNDLTPLAYSITNIRPSIFVSVGLCELLSEKEMEAVLLHELYHIRNKTSFWRFSTHTLKIFSPLSTFITLDRSISREELEADLFAAEIQQTSRHLDSAKQRINRMNRKIHEFKG